jgi:curved DNA-binding protein CbpA
MAKIYHPDKPNGSTEKFQQINYAYTILINEKTKLQYDNMKKPTKSKLIKFLEDWFNKRSDIKTFLNMNDKKIEDIMENIEIYDFNDILGLFNKMIIPNKKDTSIDCSDSDTQYWDHDYAEYYSATNLPLKYHIFNNNNIRLDLKCSIDDIRNNTIRKIKIKRKQDNTFIETSFYFNCSHPFIVFNGGGDNEGHLIIYLSLPDNYSWHDNIIYINININLYDYIYGISIPEFNIKNWITYKEGNIINIDYINNYIFAIKLNTIYNDNDENKEILKHFKTF